MFRKFLNYLIQAFVFQAPWWFVISVITLCARSGMEASLPLIIGQLTNDTQNATASVLAFICIIVTMPVILKIRDTAWAKCSASSMEYTSRIGMSHIIKLDADWHTNQHSGALTKTLSRAVTSTEEIGDIMFYTFFPVTLTTISVCAGLWVTGSAAANYIANGMIVFIIVVFAHALICVAPRYGIAAEVDSELFGTLSDVLACHSIVTASGNVDREISRLNNRIEAFGKALLHAWSENINNHVLQHVIFAAMLLPLAYQALISGNNGELVQIIAGWLVIRSATFDMASALRRLLQHYENMKKYLQIINTAPAMAEDSNLKELTIVEGMIEFKNVSFNYTGRPAVFENFNLTIPAGKTVALVGHSGCGKTTLAKLLLRLYEPASGEILIDGQDLKMCNPQSVRQSIATVLQDIPLFSRTLKENVSYFSSDKEDITSAVTDAKLIKVINQLPDGIDSVVGERGVMLSGGERQRIAIARAMHGDRPIVLLDEATSALDTETEAAVHSAITDMMKNRTAIIIAHRLSTVRSADMIVVMENGRIIETGTHEQLIQANGYYSRLCETELA